MQGRLVAEFKNLKLTVFSLETATVQYNTVYMIYLMIVLISGLGMEKKKSRYIFQVIEI